MCKSLLVKQASRQVIRKVEMEGGHEFKVTVVNTLNSRQSGSHETLPQKKGGGVGMIVVVQTFNTKTQEAEAG